MADFTAAIGSVLDVFSSATDSISQGALGEITGGAADAIGIIDDGTAKNIKKIDKTINNAISAIRTITTTTVGQLSDAQDGLQSAGEILLKTAANSASSIQRTIESASEGIRSIGMNVANTTLDITKMSAELAKAIGEQGLQIGQNLALATKDVLVEIAKIPEQFALSLGSGVDGIIKLLINTIETTVAMLKDVITTLLAIAREAMTTLHEALIESIQAVETITVKLTDAVTTIKDQLITEIGLQVRNAEQVATRSLGTISSVADKITTPSTLEGLLTFMSIFAVFGAATIAIIAILRIVIQRPV